ncbi:MAG: hypothetical protein KKA81_08780 [Bacteroidetes bacterium]|nr:hypothetical protein [Bacteroidota bacterium]
MESKAAKVISIVFQPLLIPTYGFIVLLNLNVFFALVLPPVSKWLIIGMIFTTTFVFPLIFLLILYYRGVIKTLHMESREERILPFILTIVFYYLTYYLLKNMQISPIFYYFLIGTSLTAVIALLVNFFWKISIHMVGIGGVLGAFLGLSLVLMIDIPLVLIIITLISGLVGFARLQLHAHTPAQVYAGFLAGFTIMLCLFLFI